MYSTKLIHQQMEEAYRYLLCRAHVCPEANACNNATTSFMQGSLSAKLVNGITELILSTHGPSTRLTILADACRRPWLLFDDVGTTFCATASSKTAACSLRKRNMLRVSSKCSKCSIWVWTQTRSPANFEYNTWSLCTHRIGDRLTIYKSVHVINKLRLAIILTIRIN